MCANGGLCFSLAYCVKAAEYASVVFRGLVRCVCAFCTGVNMSTGGVAEPVIISHLASNAMTGHSI